MFCWVHGFASPSCQLLELLVKPDERDATTVMSRAVDSRTPCLLKSVLDFVQRLVQARFEDINGAICYMGSKTEVRNDGLVDRLCLSVVLHVL